MPRKIGGDQRRNRGKLRKSRQHFQRNARKLRKRRKNAPTTPTLQTLRKDNAAPAQTIRNVGFPQDGKINQFPQTLDFFPQTVRADTKMGLLREI